MNVYEAALKTICTAYEITPELLRGRSRDRRLAEARCWYCLLTGSKPSGRVGRYVGRDHATVVHSRRTMKDLISTYSPYRERWRILRVMFEKYLAEESVPMPSIRRYASLWKDYRDLLSAAEAARRNLNELSTAIVGEQCWVCERREGELVVVKPTPTESDFLSLDDMKDLIRELHSGQQSTTEKNITNKKKDYEH